MELWTAGQVTCETCRQVLVVAWWRPDDTGAAPLAARHYHETVMRVVTSTGIRQTIRMPALRAEAETHVELEAGPCSPAPLLPCTPRRPCTRRLAVSCPRARPSRPVVMWSSTSPCAQTGLMARKRPRTDGTVPST